MREFRMFESGVQGSAEGAVEVFRKFIRGQVRELITRVMAMEVEDLCGPKHQPLPRKNGRAYRAGTSPGRVHIGGGRVEVVRPRVRRRKQDGKSEEVGLETYRSASDAGELEASMLAAFRAGVSTREIGRSRGTRHFTFERIAIVA